ncbi:sugar phosphate isomerase/epimerase family protein [Georgenia subflava]|uniref:TIM barrel protein n=1 Tax=Georgenia subflava TaxID=1622177 RepID=A0A6N7EI98_9MICO|nr:TIM barrel protein [Georgenia subflava]MPV37151.1 TIM barrel protein [Georgenia subflava]
MTSWRLAASTLGAPDEDLPTIVEILRRHGAAAVELRAADGAQVHVGLDAAERSGVRQLFADAGIEILAVASRVQVAAAGDDDGVVSALLAHLELAADLGAGYVRVFPGAPTGNARRDELPMLIEDVDEVDSRAVRRLAAVAGRATELGVRPVIETHDSHPRGTDVLRVLDRLDVERPGHPVGAIWDVLHPWRVGEPLEVTAAALLKHLRGGRGFVQIKDVVEPADITPVLQGSGTVPVPHMLELLAHGGYRGPVSLEWERMWYPHVEPLDPALGAAAAVLAAAGTE